MTRFSHLHVHTVYSLLDGYAPIGKLLDEVKALGMDSIAITDHGNMHGVVQFYKEAKKRDIHPVLGCEIYTAYDSYLEKDPKERGQYHLVLLAENETGYKNLMRIVSEGFIHGFYYKPRVDRTVLSKYSEGLIATSACLGGEVQYYLLQGDYEKAKAVALEYQSIFGPHNFFLELQDHGLREQKLVNQHLVKLSEETNIPLIASNDVHYVKRDDADVHDALLCIQTGKKLEDKERMKFPGEEFYLKSPDEMLTLFPYAKQALENTYEIAHRCHVDLDFSTLHLPGFVAPGNLTNQEYLRALVNDGLLLRYSDVTEEIRERAEFELKTIEDMGYVDYFLIVWDFINYARKEDIIVGPGRGSAAGSIVSYALGITGIDPMQYDLLFERFLNPERVSMPDIDIDFCYERREEVIRYVIEKYGHDHVAQIVTFGTMAARGAIRDVGRVMDVPYPKVDKIAKMIPSELNITLDAAMQKSRDLQEAYASDEETRTLIDIAREVEGLPRHTSTHAAGVVISKEPIDSYVPLCVNSGAVSTQFTMTELEELGLLKMDFLGLRTLTVLQDTVKHIESGKGKQINLETIPLNDADVIQHFHDADTVGIFQFESRGMRSFLRELKATHFEDLVAANSLFRPGPMQEIPHYIENKHNPEQVQYLHEKLKPILEKTYGVIVYQEQVMQIVQEIGGFSLGDADMLRRAMGKKKREIMAKERERFIHGGMDPSGTRMTPGAVKNGVSAEIANQIYDQMAVFADYAFNKSHSAAYALVAMRSAWLKHYYPTEFMAALLSSVIGGQTQIAQYLQEAKRMQIPILPPDINKSELKFSVEDESIRFGLLAVKGIGAGVIQVILDERKKGSFESFRSFLERVMDAEGHTLQKKTVENLIWAGAFDALHDNRAELIGIFEGEMDAISNQRKKNLAGQFSLFDTEFDASNTVTERIPKRDEFPRSIRLRHEKEVTGLYLSDHPLADYSELIEQRSTFSALDFPDNEEERILLDKKSVLYMGMMTGKSDLMTKKNEMMTFLTVEDLYGSCEIIVFPRLFRQVKDLLQDDAIIQIKGKLQTQEQDEHAKIIAEEITLLEQQRENSEGTLYLRIPSQNDQKAHQVMDILYDYPGPADVGLYYEKEKLKVKGKNFSVNGKSSQLRTQLAHILGQDNVVWIERNTDGKSSSAM